jgi:dTDP-glucose pyrophosphorylase
MICLIPAAGGGVRFKELGRQYPKAILPYKGRPILVCNIEKLLKETSVDEVVITVGHQAEKIRNCVTSFFRDEVATGRITFAEYEPINGLDGPGVSIACGLRAAVSDVDDVLIVLGDLLIESELNLDNWDSFVSVQEVPDWQRWCLVESESGVASQLFDKPTLKPPTQVALTGVYRFNNGALLAKLVEQSLLSPTSSTREAEISAFLGPYLASIPTRVRFDIAIRDFGTLETYLLNRGVASSRLFNEITFPTPDTVCKKGLNPESSAKIVEEISWYQTMPDSLSTMFPRILGSVVGINKLGQTPEYTMERVFLPTLRDFYLFLESDRDFWTEVFEVLRKSITAFSTVSGNLGSRFFSSLISKTSIRQELTPKRFQVDGISTDLALAISQISYVPPDSLFHGDMCLSNIFFDSARSRVVLVDPMGPVVGNFLYDVAKLTQCFVYDYDFIDAELYSVSGDEVSLYKDGKDQISSDFEAFVMEWLGPELTHFVHFLTAVQFLNMIPLHSHNERNQGIFFSRYLEARSRSGLGI